MPATSCKNAIAMLLCLLSVLTVRASVACLAERYRNKTSALPSSAQVHPGSLSGTCERVEMKLSEQEEDLLFPKDIQQRPASCLFISHHCVVYWYYTQGYVPGGREWVPKFLGNSSWEWWVKRNQKRLKIYTT